MDKSQESLKLERWKEEKEKERKVGDEERRKRQSGKKRGAGEEGNPRCRRATAKSTPAKHKPSGKKPRK